jgi:hypothetical protein
VILREFLAELPMPLADVVIGQQTWHNIPASLQIEFGDIMHIKNAGNRNHIFAKVATLDEENVPVLTTGRDVCCKDTLSPGFQDQCTGTEYTAAVGKQSTIPH